MSSTPTTNLSMTVGVVLVLVLTACGGNAADPTGGDGTDAEAAATGSGEPVAVPADEPKPR